MAPLSSNLLVRLHYHELASIGLDLNSTTGGGWQHGMYRLMHRQIHPGCDIASPQKFRQKKKEAGGVDSLDGTPG
ncbi:hypothetical protein THAOC_04320 [Thalassiosira oceanica]|uniref:Uncharacterized protein n=1 Tax=Thalassiosira oceanica TaxID=159749 RepID=K0TAA1_THAOC|nr:hypothetical protein THAOC_04320 [Thalassiosira oceanica]|eukprot:EJK74034.1 hypothetical protein THAOC_04320 [Thalassiosira oceanica]